MRLNLGLIMAIFIWPQFALGSLLYGLIYLCLFTIIWTVRTIMLPVRDILVPNERIDEIILNHENEQLGNARHIYETLKISGICVHVHALAIESSAVNARKLVLIHGVGGSSLSFLNLFQQLSKHFDVYAIDLPGFGRSHIDASYADITAKIDPIEFLCLALESFMDACEIQRAYISGHSFGGFIASKFQMTRPNRVRGLILLNPAGIFPTLGSHGMYWACAFKFSIPNIGVYLGRTGMFLANLLVEGESLYWYCILAHPRGIGHLFVRDCITLTPTHAYWNNPVASGLLKRRTPLCLIYGNKDTITPSHQGEALAQFHGNASLTILPESGHCPMNDTACSNAILEFTFKANREIANPHSDLDLSGYYSSFSLTETNETIVRLYETLDKHYHPLTASM